MNPKHLIRNDDAVAITVGFILMFAITVIVFTALIISFYTLTQNTEKSAMRENFKIIGSGLAAKITAVDTLINITNSYGGNVNTLEYEFSIPASVAGKTYTANITNSPYEIIFEADNGVREVALFNISTNLTPILIYSSSEDFMIKYNQSGNSIYIIEQ